MMALSRASIAGGQMSFSHIHIRGMTSIKIPRRPAPIFGK